MKVAIVCNGIKSVHHENGEFIDSCDVVIRMNRFHLHGFEKYIGSKIDVISLMLTGIGATSGILGYDPLISFVSQASSIWIPDKYRQEHKHSRVRASEHYRIKEEYFVFVDDSVYDALMDRMKTISESLGFPQEHYYPDSGMTLIETCIHRFPGAEIYVTGFDPHRKFEYKYYWEKDNPTTEAFNYHPQKAEAFLYDEYIKLGKIKEI
jgi:hypothetical protein